MDIPEDNAKAPLSLAKKLRRVPQGVVQYVSMTTRQYVSHVLGLVKSYWPHTPLEIFFSTNDLPSTLTSAVFDVLQEYEDVFLEEVSPGLPPKRGIEHQIDLVPGAPLPNRTPYRTNPKDIKKFSAKYKSSSTKVM